MSARLSIPAPGMTNGQMYRLTALVKRYVNNFGLDKSPANIYHYLAPCLSVLLLNVAYANTTVNSWRMGTRRDCADHFGIIAGREDLQPGPGDAPTRHLKAHQFKFWF